MHLHMLLIDTETRFSPDIMWRLFLYNQTHTHNYQGPQDHTHTHTHTHTGTHAHTHAHAHAHTHTHTHTHTLMHTRTRTHTHTHTCTHTRTHTPLQINRANNPAHIAAITQHRSGERERERERNTMNFTSHRTLTSSHHTLMRNHHTLPVRRSWYLKKRLRRLSSPHTNQQMKHQKPDKMSDY